MTNEEIAVMINSGYIIICMPIAWRCKRAVIIQPIDYYKK